MDNKGKSAVVSTILIILLVVTAVGIIRTVIVPKIKNSMNPEFTIYKEECWNETIIEDVVVPLHLISYLERENLPTRQELLKVCERLGGEVYHNSKRDINWSFTAYCTIKDLPHQNESCTEEMVGKGVMKKEHLAIDWLEENGQISGCEGEGRIYQNRTCCYGDGDYDGKKRVKIGDEYCENKKIIRYKWRGYTVEVSR